VSCWHPSWHVHWQMRHKKILGHTWVAPIMIGNWKWILVTNPTMTKKFRSPSLRCVIMTLPFTWKNILRQKKNYGNSNISPCNNIIFKKNPLKETKLLQDITTLSLIPSFNTSQNIISIKSSYKNRPTTWGPKFVKLLYSIMNLNTISLTW
jgi:hypothetical protein